LPNVGHKNYYNGKAQNFISDDHGMTLSCVWF
jgi:hypothetical protein